MFRPPRQRPKRCGLILTAVGLCLWLLSGGLEGSSGPGAQLAAATQHDDTVQDDLTGLIDDLETRFRNTSAMGFLTKLHMKGKLDQMINEISDYHDGRSKFSIDQLRDRFDLLVDKVMVLVQDDDAKLAKDIDADRAKLWSALSDRDTFKTLRTRLEPDGSMARRRA